MWAGVPKPSVYFAPLCLTPLSAVPSIAIDSSAARASANNGPSTLN